MSEIAATLEAKDPSDKKDYAINWADVLTAEGETTIASSTWGDGSPADSVPSGLTIENTSPYVPYISGTRCIVWVSGGTAGTRYSLTNTIVTAGAIPRTHQRTIIIPCVQR